ncbi:MAG TPA: tetratricopeptide repeat protein [Vicinamibacterales bacterium]|nr:tetratricopeptide repeat protein [Vicinamibacterales bacterium]
MILGSSRGPAAAAAILVLCFGLALWRQARNVPAGRDLAAIPEQNVLLVTIDTLRGDALGCDGGPAKTPNIDALAAAGVRFTFAHSHAVITLPSHASILTGTYPFQHGYRENSGYRLRAGTPTLATILKARGFSTAAFVGAFPLDARFGLTPGFDVYDGRFDDASGAGVFQLPERPAGAVVGQALNWIGRQSAHKWLAWVHVFDPHAPYVPPSPFNQEYAGRPYYGEVAAVDSALGPLLDAARRSPRPTLVVLTGDHGEALGDHGESTHGLFAYESTLHVPLVIAQVGTTMTAPAIAEVVTAPVRHVDLLPTILDALQIAPPSGLPGRSLRKASDRNDSVVRPSYFEAMSSMLQFGWAPLQGVLAGREKYIHLPIPELYDLARDPSELQNIVDRAGDRRRVLTAHLRGFEAALPGTPQQEDPQVLARLRALGYVSGGAPAKAQYGEADDPKRLVDLDRLLHEGVALDSEGRTEEAITRYRELVARRPDMMSASRHLAFDYWQLGNTRLAIETLQAALHAGQPTTGAQVQLATYLSEMGRIHDAIAMLEPLASGTSADLDTLNALAIAYARSGRRGDALKTFDRALTIDAANTMIHENVGALHLDAGDLPSARAAFERALASNPRSAQALAGLAMIALKTGHPDQAIEGWKRAVDIDPTNYDALYNLGIQLVRAGQPWNARPYLERFVATAPPGPYSRDIADMRALLAKMPR